MKSCCPNDLSNSFFVPEREKCNQHLTFQQTQRSSYCTMQLYASVCDKSETQWHKGERVPKDAGKMTNAAEKKMETEFLYISPELKKFP